MTISNKKDGQKAVGLDTGGGEWSQLAGCELPTWYDDVKLGVFVHWGPYSVPRPCSCRAGCRSRLRTWRG